MNPPAFTWPTAALLALTLTATACQPAPDGSAAEEVAALETRLEGLEAALARQGLSAGSFALIGADTLLCGEEQSYADSIRRSYIVKNECEFSAYVQVFDTAGDYVRQEKISGYSTDTVTVGAFESVDVRCTYVTSPNGRCIITAH